LRKSWQNKMKITAEQVFAGEEKVIARAISLIENERQQVFPLLKELYSRSELAYLLGVTGPPGSGKSTLVAKIVSGWVREGNKVAVIAIDPTSEFSGGALLGDRIRMDDISTNKDVFIRSMATRGYLGGLNPAIFDTVVVLSAAGYKKIVIETVGVGQNEIDIVSLADTTLVVTVPEAGDEVQAFKAGLMEAGDIFVLNKADHPEVNKMELVLKQMLRLGNTAGEQAENRWEVPIVKTIATTEKGIAELNKTIAEHQEFLTEKGENQKAPGKIISNHLIHLLEESLKRKYLDPLKESPAFAKLLQEIAAKKTDPYSAMEELMANFKERLG